MAGVTPHPNEAWLVQVARNVTREEWGFLSAGQYLIHDRDGKYCPAFQQIIDTSGITRVPLALGALREGGVSLTVDSLWGSDAVSCP